MENVLPVKAGGVRPTLVWRALPCFGIWTIHTWIMWINTHNPLTGTSFSPWFSVYLSQSVFLIAVALLFFRKALRPVSGFGKADFAFTAAGCLITILYGASMLGMAIPLAASLVAVVLSGMCLGWFYLRWGVFYRGLSLRNALGCIFAACILGALAKSALAMLPPTAGLAFAVALPFLSTLFLTKASSQQHPMRNVEVRYTKSTVGSLWKVMGCIAVYAFVYAFAVGLPKMYESAIENADIVGHVIEISVSAFILWWVLKRNRSLSFVQLWRGILLLIGIMLVLSVFEPTAGFQTVCSTSISYLVVVFLWLLLSDLAHHSDLHPFVIFGAGWVAYTFPYYLGRLLGPSGIVPAMNPSVALVLLFLITLVITLLLENRDPVLQRIFSDLDESAPAPQDFALIDERCTALADAYGLTAREVEVMQMVCKGRSKAYIAETLFITENTVRGHARRLYAKLDVHSKKELQELIGV